MSRGRSGHDEESSFMLQAGLSRTKWSSSGRSIHMDSVVLSQGGSVVSWPNVTDWPGRERRDKDKRQQMAVVSQQRLSRSRSRIRASRSCCRVVPVVRQGDIWEGTGDNKWKAAHSRSRHDHVPGPGPHIPAAVLRLSLARMTMRSNVRCRCSRWSLDPLDGLSRGT